MSSTRRCVPITLVVVLAMLVSCGDGGDADAGREPGGTAPRSGGTAVVAIASEPDVLNSLVNTSAVAGMTLSLMQCALVEMGEDLGWEPMIATHWDVAADSLSITYHLRPWRWEDERPLTSEDVRLSWELLRDPVVASPRADLLRAAVACETPDPATVRYRFAAPQSRPVQSTFHAILPAHVIARLDRASVNSWPINRQPLASGPFRLAAWEPGRQIVLEHNPVYPLEPPLLDRVVLRVLPDETARIIALEAGEVDVVADLPAAAARRLARDPGVVLHEVPSRVFGFVMWNLRDPVLADTDVRRALSLGVDRRRLVADVLGGFGEPAATCLPPVLWNHHDDLAADPFRPDSARALLAAAGWLDQDGNGVRERDGRPLRLTLIHRGGDTRVDAAAVLLRHNLRDIGVDVQLRGLELATALDFLADGRFQGYLGEFQANLYADPSPLIGSGAASRFNFGGYADARADSLLSAALADPDRLHSLRAWRALQEELAADQPHCMLYYLRQVVAVDSRIRDARPHVLGPLNNVTQWWIEPGERRWAAGATAE